MKNKRGKHKLLQIVLIALPAIPLLAYLLSPKKAAPVRHLKKEEGKAYRVPDHWLGVPIDRKNRFLNYLHPYYQNYNQILRWLPSHAMNLLRNENRSAKFPVIKHNDTAFLTKENILIWLGHASFFLRIRNKNILIDPHFYNTSIYRRHTDPPIASRLFTNIDYILLSHDHEDHCDERSLFELVQNNPDVIVLAGLNMAPLLKQITKHKGLSVATAQWYEKFAVAGDIEFYFVPSRHYCHRPFNKYNSRLWGGFIIKYKSSFGSKNITLYFGGDSAYDSHFKDIGDLFAPDIAMIGIGAFKPRWFMHPVHMSPGEALQAITDLGNPTFIPMHHQTFNLSNEMMTEPDAVLTQLKANYVKLVAGEEFMITL